jgi:CRP-like cAMP-binding protein
MSANEKYVKLARQVALFRGLNPEEVHKIFARGTTMNVDKGNIIFHKGTTGNQMFVVLGGKISLYSGKKHLADLKAGDMFGEMALISSEPRSATAVAAERSLVFVLSEQIFHKIMTKRAAIRILLNIVGTLSTRLRDMNQRLPESGQ